MSHTGLDFYLSFTPQRQVGISSSKMRVSHPKCRRDEVSLIYLFDKVRNLSFILSLSEYQNITNIVYILDKIC